MKNIIRIFCGFFLTIILLGCPGEDIGGDIVGNIKIQNNSEKNIVYLPWFIDKDYFGDSIFSPQVSPWDNIVKYTIEPDTCAKLVINQRKRDAIEHDKNLLIFFFDSDTLSQVTWERIARDNIILKRVDLHSWEELENCNFELAYP
jgi:hypothetical protein